MILRVFTSPDSKLLMRAFKTYVRPILEYACEVVNPYLARDVETLERVQRDYIRGALLLERVLSILTTMIDCAAWKCHCLVSGVTMPAC